MADRHEIILPEKMPRILVQLMGLILNGDRKEFQSGEPIPATEKAAVLLGVGDFAKIRNQESAVRLRFSSQEYNSTLEAHSIFESRRYVDLGNIFYDCGLNRSDFSVGFASHGNDNPIGIGVLLHKDRLRELSEKWLDVLSDPDKAPKVFGYKDYPSLVKELRNLKSDMGCFKNGLILHADLSQDREQKLQDIFAGKAPHDQSSAHPGSPLLVQLLALIMNAKSEDIGPHNETPETLSLQNDQDTFAAARNRRQGVILRIPAKEYSATILKYVDIDEKESATHSRHPLRYRRAEAAKYAPVIKVLDAFGLHPGVFSVDTDNMNDIVRADKEHFKAYAQNVLRMLCNPEQAAEKLGYKNGEEYIAAMEDPDSALSHMAFGLLRHADLNEEARKTLKDLAAKNSATGDFRLRKGILNALIRPHLHGREGKGR